MICQVCYYVSRVSFLPVHVKNFDSPTLSSTLFSDIDTWSTAVTEREKHSYASQSSHIYLYCIYSLQIVSKQLHRDKQENNSVHVTTSSKSGRSRDIKYNFCFSKMRPVISHSSPQERQISTTSQTVLRYLYMSCIHLQIMTVSDSFLLFLLYELHTHLRQRLHI